MKFPPFGARIPLAIQRQSAIVHLVGLTTFELIPRESAPSLASPTWQATISGHFRTDPEASFWSAIYMEWIQWE